MALHPLAGEPVPPDATVNVPRLVTRYFTVRPDPACPEQRVSFGTSGHRGTSLDGSFNEAHIAAIAQAVCRLRRARGVTGPLFLGMDTHALSEPAHATVLEVLAANDVEVRVAANGGYTPTPAISHAILCHNRLHPDAPADGIVVTPSHNPPEDGGLKYNPPSGGPADTDTTGTITVWGIKDGRPGDALGTDWTETGITGANAPLSPDFAEDTDTTALGTFEFSIDTATYSVATQALTDFVEADTNGEVTFLITRNEGDGNFYLQAREHPSGGVAALRKI